MRDAFACGWRRARVLRQTAARYTPRRAGARLKVLAVDVPDDGG